MPDPIITNNDADGLVVGMTEYESETITFAGAGTLVSGTILARDSVSLKLVPFVKGGVTNENGIPKAVLRGDLTAAGAGDKTCRVIVMSEGLRFSKMVIDADGDNSNIDKAVEDQLRDYGIKISTTTQLSELDNQ